MVLSEAIICSSIDCGLGEDKSIKTLAVGSHAELFFEGVIRASRHL